MKKWLACSFSLTGIEGFSWLTLCLDSAEGTAATAGVLVAGLLAFKQVNTHILVPHEMWKFELPFFDVPCKLVFDNVELIVEMHLVLM